MTNYQDILYKYEKLKKQGRDLTFMEICRYPGSRFEEVCSRVLRYFFDPESKHGLNTLLLEAFFETLNIKSTYDFEEIYIEIEQYAANKRIDMIIEGSDFVVGIENKIFAPLDNNLSLYRKKIKAYGKKEMSTFCVVLTLRNLSIDEKLKATSNNFKVVKYLDFFKIVKNKLTSHTESKPIIYLNDFIKTLEKLINNNMDTNQIEFFKENSKEIEKLLQDYNQYKKSISKKQISKIAFIHSEIKKRTNAKWKIYQKFDLWIKARNEDNELGIESWFIEDSSSPIAIFRIMFVSWRRKDWDEFQDEVNKHITKGKSKRNGSKDFMIYKDIYNPNDDDILNELESAFLILNQIVNKEGL